MGGAARRSAVSGAGGLRADQPGEPGDALAPLATEPTFYESATQMPQGLLNLAHVWFQPSWIVRVRAGIGDDAAALSTVLVLLGVVALAATLIPALRAARIDPAETLRAE